MTTHDVVGEHLEAGREAAARYAWREALEALSSVDASVGLSPEDLERLAKAAWWTGRADQSIEAHERAYAAHVERGDRARAAFLALTLRREYAVKLAHSVAAGWLQRAEHLLEGDPGSPAHGYLALAHGTQAWNAGDLETALRHMDRAAEIAGRFNDRDLQAWTAMYRGMVLVAMGGVDEGMSLMEEVSAAAVGGELGPYTTGAVFCNTIEVCRDLADYRRAGEWSAAAKRWCERQAISGFPGICRVRRAEVMRMQGDWIDAEQDASLACEELIDFNPHTAGEAFHELGELRLGKGDLAGAEEAFRQAHQLGVEPQPGLALLLLARGKPDAAATSIRRSLEDESWNRLARARLLPAQAEIASARRDVETIRTAADELAEIAAEFGATALRATHALVLGTLALAQDDPAAAVRHLRRARQLWGEVEAPYEVARAELLLAQAHLAEGDDEAAALELGAARATLERLGALPDARRTAELVAGLETASAARDPRVARTFMFTDIVGSTTLIEAIGDSAWQDLRRWHDQTLRTCFAEHGGEEIDHAGDGFFLAFPDARSAIECAMEIQRKLADHRRTHGFAPQIRIGLHATEATQSGDQYTGKGVHAAARIGALAQGGEILASAGTLAGVDGLATAEPREVTLKGISEPVAVVSIDWR